jgi:hypothetical protein
MKKTIFAFLILFFTTLLTACGNPLYSPAPGQAEAPTLQVAAAAPTLMSEPTLPSATAAPSPTLEPTVEVPYRRDCFQIEEKVPSNLILDGAILLNSQTPQGGVKRSMIHLDLHSQRKSILPYSTGPIALSPDGKWLAYLDLAYNQKGEQKSMVLQMTDAEGRRRNMSHWGLTRQTLIGWQGRDHLVVESPGYPGGNYLVLNPFTWEMQVYQVDVPPRRSDAPTAYPDPTLAYWVIQPEAVGSEPFWRLLARDGWQTLWEGGGSPNMPPLWARDGHAFALMSSVNEPNGHKTWQLLRVGNQGAVTPLSRTLGVGEALTWSPDRHYLGGWLQLDPNSSASPDDLVLIDANEPSLTAYCLEDQRGSNPQVNTAPVWSPDSHYMAVAVARNVSDEWSETIYWDTVVIDLQEHRAYRLVKDAVPQAWMKKP